MSEHQTELLAGLDEASLAEVVPGLGARLAEEGRVRLLASGETLCLAGEVPETLWILLRGRLELYAPGERGARIGTLIPKRSLALREILAREAYRYSAVAPEGATVVGLEVEVARGLIGADPELRAALALLTSSSAVRAFREALRPRLSRPELHRILAAIDPNPLRVPASAAFPTAPGLYFLQSGRLRLGDRTLGEGAWLGGSSLVPPNRFGFSAAPASECRFHFAPAERIAPILESLGVLDLVHAEPIALPAAPAPAAEASLPVLRGLALPIESLPALGFPANPNELLRADDAEGAVGAALANAAVLLGVGANAARLQAGARLSARLSFHRLAAELEDFGLILDPLEASGERAPIATPALAFVGGRLVCLLFADEERVIVLDPIQGLLELQRADADAHWDRRYLWVRRAEPSADRPQSTREQLRSILRDRRVELRSFAGLSLLGLLTSVLSPWIMQYLVDDVLSLGALDLALGLILGLVAIAASRAVLAVLEQGLAIELSSRFDRDLLALLYRRALRLPAASFGNERVGDALSRLMAAESVRDFFSGATVAAVLATFSLLGGVLVLFAYAPRIGAIGAVMIALMMAAQTLTRRRLLELRRQEFLATREATSHLTEMVQAMATVKAVGAERGMLRRFEAAFLGGVLARREVDRRGNDAQLLIGTLGALGFGAGMVAAGLAALEGSLSPGRVLAVGLVFQGMAAPIGAISGLIVGASELTVSLEKLSRIFEGKPEEEPERVRVSHAPRLLGRVRAEALRFRYAVDRPWVLDGIDFVIHPGQTVAIVGKSGSGKTTLAKILAGELRPSEGRLFYDQFDAEVIARGALRQQIGVVEQGYALFSGSIRENIALGEDAPDDEAVRRAAELADADRFIREAPQAYAQVLGPRGLGLSGGQRQRVAIARAIQRDPAILILDEALSALDAHSEAAIRQNMAEITRGRTTVVIAHRASTVRQADRILVIDGGRIVEEGDHRSLLGRGGLYAELFEGKEEGRGAGP